MRSPLIIALSLWTTSCLLGCSGSGSYKLQIVFPSEEARQQTLAMSLVVFEPSGRSCDELTNGSVDLSSLIYYSKQIFEYPPNTSVVLNQVPARELLFYAEGHNGNVILLKGCSRATVKARSEIEVVVELVWTKICDPGGMQDCVCPTGGPQKQSCSEDGTHWESCPCNPDEDGDEGPWDADGGPGDGSGDDGEAIWENDAGTEDCGASDCLQSECTGQPNGTSCESDQGVCVNGFCCTICNRCIRPSQDSYVDTNVPTTNFGTDPKILTGRGTGFIFRKGLVKFDFDPSSFPPGGGLESALLTLEVVYWGGASGNVGIYSINGSWDAATVTWLTAPLNSLDPAATAIAAWGQRSVFDITSLVNQWISNPALNFGMMLVMVDDGRSIGFASLDNSDSTKRPCLELKFQ